MISTVTSWLSPGEWLAVALAVGGLVVCLCLYVLSTGNLPFVDDDEREADYRWRVRQRQLINSIIEELTEDPYDDAYLRYELRNALALYRGGRQLAGIS